MNIDVLVNIDSQLEETVNTLRDLENKKNNLILRRKEECVKLITESTLLSGITWTIEKFMGDIKLVIPFEQNHLLAKIVFGNCRPCLKLWKNFFISIENNRIIIKQDQYIEDQENFPGVMPNWIEFLETFNIKLDLNKLKEPKKLYEDEIKEIDRLVETFSSFSDNDDIGK